MAISTPRWYATGQLAHSARLRLISNRCDVLNCYLHDLSKQCTMILASCKYGRNPCQSFLKEYIIALIRERP